MQRKKFAWWISATLVILLVAITGCQAIQGLDLGLAIQNSSNIKSAESKGSLQMELVTGNTEHLSADEKLMIQVLKNVKLELNSAKMQDKQHLSVDGALTYSKGSIPFKITVDGTKFILHIEGSKKPIVFDSLAAQVGSSATPLSEELQQQLVKKVEDIQPALLKFLLTNAPNPTHLSVSSVSEQVHNETLSLQKAHVELNGSELSDLLKAFLTNILADEKGMKELLGQLYDALIPVIKEQMKAYTSNSDLNSAIPGLISAYLDNKILMVEFVYTTIHHFLTIALTDWDKNMQDTLSSETSSQIKALLSEQTLLKTDFFIDSDKQIRKANMELTIPITEANAGVTALKFTYSYEVWNINKPVTADVIDISGGSLNIDGQSITSSSFLNNFNKDSKFYKLLREDLKIAKEEIHLQLNQDSEDYYLDDYFYGDDSHPYINDEEVAMLPVRFITKFGAEVKWNEEAKQITLKDGLTDTTILLTLNSKTASVNGSPVQLDSAVILKNGSTYVPLRFIAEKLGCKIDFDNDTQRVTITRY